MHRDARGPVPLESVNFSCSSTASGERLEGFEDFVSDAFGRLVFEASSCDEGSMTVSGTRRFLAAGRVASASTSTWPFSSGPVPFSFASFAFLFFCRL